MPVDSKKGYTLLRGEDYPNIENETPYRDSEDDSEGAVCAEQYGKTLQRKRSVFCHPLVLSLLVLIPVLIIVVVMLCVIL